MKKLFVGNLPFDVGEKELHDFFTSRGIEVSSISVCRERDTQMSRGFAFVELQEDLLESALKVSGQRLGERQIKIDEARPREESKGRRR